MLSATLKRAQLSPSVLRLATVMAALAVIYLRTPITFHAPQMWGEDIDFFLHAKTFGWKSLMIPEAGYLSFAQSLTALISRLFKAQLAAKIYCYVAIGLTLLVVWLVTSPRLALPSKPILALAIVIVPMGFEELGTITNIQWILPIGGFAILFMTMPKANLIGPASEVIFLVLMALSGPFSVFMAPMFIAMSCKKIGFERKRLVLLSSVVSLGALVQIYFIILSINRDIGIMPTKYAWDLWFTIPARQILTVIPGLSNVIEGGVGICAAVLLLGLAAIASFTAAYQDQKRCMILLSLSIALGGMLKFRVALDTQASATRYFYAGSVFTLWIVCCASENKSVQRVLTLLVVATEVALLPVVAFTPRTEYDYNWPVWARQIDIGLPLIIPTAPGWYTKFPAALNGQLYKYSGWSGRTLTSIDPVISPDPCPGLIETLDQLPKTGKRTPWSASGVIGGQDNPHTMFRFVALVDDEDRVVGFGYSGFRLSDPAADSGSSGWQSIFFADAKQTLRAYAVAVDGTVCHFENEVPF